MADIHDVIASQKETEDHVRMLRTYCGQVEDGDRDGDLMLGLAAVAVVAAVQELATRIDYVIRELAKR